MLRGASVIASFFFGAFFGTLLADASGRFRLPTILTLEAALFGAAITLTMARPGFFALLPVAAAMGMQNTLRQLVGRANVANSFVTGSLFNAGQSLARALTGAAPRAEWLAYLRAGCGRAPGFGSSHLNREDDGVGGRIDIETDAWFGIRRATPSRFGTINPIDMSKTESPKFTVSVKAATGWPLLRALVNRDVVAPRRPNVELARTPNLLTWILDHFLPLRDPAGGARHRE